jgi:NTP pyrophosphatase (non-canonical NTP hydrolase)
MTLTSDTCSEAPKPEGVPAELADVIIRVLDFCGAREIDIDRAIEAKIAFNKTRPPMHGKRF